MDGCPPGSILFWITNAHTLSNKIQFYDGLFAGGPPVINIKSALPDLRYTSIEIDGKGADGSRITIDGSQAGPQVPGIQTGDHRHNLLNMVIRNFGGDGVLMDGTDNSVLRNLTIYNNGGHGIRVLSLFPAYGNSQNLVIGGSGPSEGNVIFGNGGDGINITRNTAYDWAHQNIQIINNRIGTADGVNPAPNGSRGISLVNTWGVTVGDPSGLTKNIISGNGNDGVTISGAQAVGNEVYWNNIGTNIAGDARLGNGASGVALLADAGRYVDASHPPNRIGKPGFPNLISANGTGVFIADPNTSHNIVQGNLIGTNAGGNSDLGNSGSGIYFANGTYDNLIGGTAANEGNLIAYNNVGIFANGGVRNSFRRNRIASNKSLGIDLAPGGVTLNDPADGDSGPNGLQNFPVLTSINSQSGSVTLSGSLNAAPGQLYTIEFFGNPGVDATGYGEGRNYLGSTQITTNASGDGVFLNQTFTSTPSAVGSWVTATATDATGNTSEFSQATNICQSMSFSPNSTVMSETGGSSNFLVLYSTGCSSYSGQSSTNWITVNSVLAGTVTYSVAQNLGTVRQGYVTVNYNNGSAPASKSFLVTQQGPTVVYDGNGNTGGTAPVDTLAYATAERIVMGNPGGLSRKGYYFSGWNTLPSGQGTNYVAGNTFTITPLYRTLYARWTPEQAALTNLTTSVGVLSPAFDSANPNIS